MLDMTKMMKQAVKDHQNLYLVEIEFVDKIAGGRPATEEILEAFQKAQKTPSAIAAKELAELRETLECMAAQGQNEAVEEQVAALVGDGVQKARTIFMQDKKGPWMGAYQIKCCLREAATTLGINMEKRGVKHTIQTTVAPYACDENAIRLEGVQAERVHFYRGSCGDPELDWDDEFIVPRIDDYYVKTATIDGAQGKRNIVKQHAFVGATDDGPIRARFVLEVGAGFYASREAATVTDKDIMDLLAFFGNNGLGACRSQEFGKFVITRLVKITDNPLVMAGVKISKVDADKKPSKAKAKAKTQDDDE